MGINEIETIYILLPLGEKRLNFLEPLDFISRILPSLNWSSEIWIDSGNLSKDFLEIKAIIEMISSFLVTHGFIRVNLLLIHPWSEDQRLSFFECYRELSRLIFRFRSEAYYNQSESRLSLISIIKEPETGFTGSIYSFLDFLKDTYIPCCILFNNRSSLLSMSMELGKRIERIFLKMTDEGDEGLYILRTLSTNRLLDFLYHRGEAINEIGLHGACPSQIIIDVMKGLIYGCWRDFLEKRNAETMMGNEGVAVNEVFDILSRRGKSEEVCNSCMDLALREMESQLKVIKRESDGEAEMNWKRMADIHVKIGLNRLQIGDIEGAFDSMKRARLIDGQSAIIDFYLGIINFHLKDYIEATDLFKIACNKGLPPDLLKELYFYKGVSHIHLEEFEDAIHAMEHAGNLGIQKAPVLYYTGMGYLGMGKIDEALNYFLSALDSDPSLEDRGRILFYLGVCEKEREEYPRAIEWLKEAEKIEGPVHDIYNLMGFCYFKLREYERAIFYFEEAIKCNPRSAIDYANIGSNLKELGRYEEAIKMYRRALEIDPNIGFARSNLDFLEKEILKR
jgi:tetratricopeptide (TPR) repeat protein